MPRKKKKVEEDEDGLNLDCFPQVRSTYPRKLYFDSVPAADDKALRKRGYDPVVLRSIPRDTKDANEEYIRALLIGVQDGTITRTKEAMSAVKLDMTTRGMLEKNDIRTELQIQIGASIEDVKQLWEWKESRHSLQGNTTMVKPEQIVDTLQRADEEGKKKK